MKKYKKLLLMGSVFLTFAGCGEEFLDKKPLARLGAANFYKTESDMLQALTAAYDVLQWQDMFGSIEWYLGDVVSDDAVKGGGGASDGPEILDLEEFRTSPSNPIMANRYRTAYKAIFRANTVLEHIDAVETPLKERIRAEAKFIRGLSYFELAKVFGGVPLVLTVLTPDEQRMPRASVDETYAQIEKDFSEAAAALPESYGAGDVGRATKGAANGFLAKAYLFHKKWAESKAASDAVINSGVYSLLPDYGKIFTPEGENSSESLFEIQHKDYGNGWADQHEGTVITVFQSPRDGEWGGWGFNQPTQEFVNAFEPGDPRKDYTVLMDGEKATRADGKTITYNKSSSDTGYNNQKYANHITANAPNQGAADSPQNVRVLRYADILLMNAEAAAELGQEDIARQRLKEVRARVGLGPITASGQALKDAIFQERRVELGLEGHRFFDLARTGRAAAVMRASGKTNFVAGTHELFPIPQGERDINPDLVQNPGYQ